MHQSRHRLDERRYVERPTLGIVPDRTTPAESIVIACISKSLPRLDIYSAQNVGPLNLAELTQPQAAETWTDNTSWEDWNTESVINLTEIRITTHNDRSSQ